MPKKLNQRNVAMSSAVGNSSRSIDLSRLAEPFEESDIEWRVSRSGIKREIYCMCLAYCTARAIMKRLDEVCGPENWKNEAMQVHELRTGPIAIQVGISIRINGEWITKWDVSEPTKVEPAKGGFSGAMKRAGAQWGIGRYLYLLDETFAEVSEETPKGGTKGWNFAKLPDNKGNYWWRAPKLPSWALPSVPEHAISEQELNDLKKQWKDKFAPESKNPSDLRDGFLRFVHSICGEFPISDLAFWSRDALEKCMKRIADTVDHKGVSSDVPFGS